MRGKLIVIEGLDASGKATQTRLLAERINASLFSFPNYDSRSGQLIDGHLKKRWAAMRPEGLPGRAHKDKEIDAYVFQSLQAVNKIEMLWEIEAARTKGPTVLDRYWQSAFVYGLLTGLDEHWLIRTQEIPVPISNINILIDVSVEESFKRRPERRDQFESRRDFMQDVRQGYLKLFSDRARRENPMLGFKQRWFVVNGERSVEDVHNEIVQIVEGSET